MQFIGFFAVIFLDRSLKIWIAVTKANYSRSLLTALQFGQENLTQNIFEIIKMF